MDALRLNMQELGITVKEVNGNTLQVKGRLVEKECYSIRAYADHRVAMSFAAALPVLKCILLDEVEVVNKSFPGFWNEMEKTGAKIS